MGLYFLVNYGIYLNIFGKLWGILIFGKLWDILNIFDKLWGSIFCKLWDIFKYFLVNCGA